MTPTPDPLREAAPAYDDPEAKRARAGVAAALFGGAPQEPVRVGRYELLGRIGAGGMGVVHRAHDPELDRPVAVKLLRAEVSADGKARARMLREARSLAKLSHPNVITVYDVGTVDGEDGPVFVAMELVAGKDLRRWLADRRGSEARPGDAASVGPSRQGEGGAWIEVLERFLAAGRGLEAAHEAGLIHRDFKPENVLVGDDGRVRVLDFGLARVSTELGRGMFGSEAASEAGSAAGPGATGDLERSTSDVARLPTVESARGVDGGLTETGAVLGTPLYMAPELYAGRSADAASDQFAFCASLWEGIYGRRPFGADTLARHVEAVKAGSVAEPPIDSPVPIELHRIARRGLEPDPRARYPSMHALLHELEQLVRQASSGSAVIADDRRGSGPWLAVGGIVLAAVFGLIGLELGWFGDEDPPLVREQVEAEPESAPDGTALPVEVEPNTTTSSTDAIEEPSKAATEGGASDQPEGPAGQGTRDGFAGTGEGSGTPSIKTSSEPEASDWCHLHEDSYTLLVRTAKRRANFEHAGSCYVCRVESRRSRTRNFTPRDCAGYSLCGSSAVEDCR